MLELQEKKKLRRVLYSPLFLIILSVAVIIIARGVWGVRTKATESGERLQASLSELETLQRREQNLAADIEKLKTPRGVEEEIREKFRVAKEGEHLIVLLGEEEIPQSLPAEELSWWQKMIRIFNF